MKDYRIEDWPDPAEHAGLIGTVPTNTDYDALVEPPARFWIGDRLVGVYQTLDRADLEQAHAVMRSAEYQDSRRSGGLPTRSAVYGALPRIPMRNNYCRFTAESMRAPELMRAVQHFARRVSAVYQAELPEAYAEHIAASEGGILSDYLIPDTPFTTCNFNVNHAIKYHTDTGNSKGVFSNVIILRYGVTGGELVLPAFRAALSQRHGALIIFDGQRLVHGVTEIVRKKPDGYRCSIVLYALAGMANCYPMAEELERARGWRTEVEAQPLRPELIRGAPQGRVLGKLLRDMKDGSDGT